MTCSLLRSLAFAAMIFALPLSTWAGSIGVNFNGSAGGSGTLAPGDTAGFIPQTNFNSLGGPNGGAVGAPLPLVDSTGASTTAGLVYTSGGVYSVQGGGATVNQTGDEALNAGFIYGNAHVEVTDVPYAAYDVYVYMLNDAGGRPQTVILNGTSTFYGTTPNPADPGYVDNSALTPYLYQLATSTTAGTFTNPANYVHFAGVTGSSFTLDVSAPGNGYLNGFQIVQVPEPSSVLMAALGLCGLAAISYCRKR